MAWNDRKLYTNYKWHLYDFYRKKYFKYILLSDKFVHFFQCYLNIQNIFTVVFYGLFFQLYSSFKTFIFLFWNYHFFWFSDRWWWNTKLTKTSIFPHLLLQHNNALYYITILIKNTIHELGWEVLHPPHSPDLVPSDYHYFIFFGCFLMVCEMFQSIIMLSWKWCSTIETCWFLPLRHWQII